jgi:hypothetical protein
MGLTMNAKNSLPDELKKYLSNGWPLIPLWGAKESGECLCGKAGCEKPGKHPRITGWPENASKDREIVNGWMEEYPGCNWGVLCGKKSGIVVIDVDCHGAVNGMPKWNRLMKWAKKYKETPIKTLTVHTPHLGLHLYFKYPSGDIKLPPNLDVGIDVKADRGYVLAPPSVIRDPYLFATTEDTPGLNTPIQEMPGWLLKMLEKRASGGKPVTPRQSSTGGVGQTHSGRSLGKREMEENLRDAFRYLNALKKSRVDNYEDWIAVGMALHECGQGGLEVWDGWSKQSDKYKSGACAQKWLTFTPAKVKGDGITFASLVHWAEEDKGAPNVREAPKQALPSDFKNALAAMGYTFQANDMNDGIFLKGTLVSDADSHKPISDLYLAKIRMDMREYGYKGSEVVLDCIYSLALENHFHPIKDYLNGLQWDGKDHIAELAGYFQDKDGVFPELLEKWLIGAVDRVIGKRPGEQQPMLVLDGKQGIGKSRFVYWLGSSLPAFYMTNPIHTEDKDYDIHLCSKFVWEVQELEVTLRRADSGAMKAFLTKEIIDVRKPYGHGSIQKPATASFIGTINNCGGFLSDPTGSRRYRVCTLTKIDWKYSDMDIDQIWAQAVALLHKGRSSELSKATEDKMLEINSGYETDDPIAFPISSLYDIDPSKRDRYTTASEIMEALRQHGKISGGNDQQVLNGIGSVLTRWGCEHDRIREGKKKYRIWRGVFLKDGGIR